MALICLAADKGAPGVTTTAVAMAAVWPRPVLLAECDPAGGDVVYRLPAADGGRLDPRRGLLSLAVSARRGLAPAQVWEHTQKLRGGLDVLAGITNAEQGAGLDLMWDQLGSALAGLPQADVIADCGRLGAEGRSYDLLGRADAVVMITRASLSDMVRLRDRVSVVEAALRRRGGTASRIGVVVIADYKHFSVAQAEVRHVLDRADSPVSVLGGLAFEPRSAELLSGEWGGKLDKSLLIRTARQIAAGLAGQLPAPTGGGGPAAGHRELGGGGAAAPEPAPRGQRRGRRGRPALEHPAAEPVPELYAAVPPAAAARPGGTRPGATHQAPAVPVPPAALAEPAAAAPLAGLPVAAERAGPPAAAGWAGVPAAAEPGLRADPGRPGEPVLPSGTLPPLPPLPPSPATPGLSSPRPGSAAMAPPPGLLADPAAPARRNLGGPGRDSPGADAAVPGRPGAGDVSRSSDSSGLPSGPPGQAPAPAAAPEQPAVPPRSAPHRPAPARPAPLRQVPGDQTYHGAAFAGLDSNDVPPAPSGRRARREPEPGSGLLGAAYDGPGWRDAGAQSAHPDPAPPSQARQARPQHGQQYQAASHYQQPPHHQQSDWWTAPDPWAPADPHAADATPRAGRGRYEPPAAQGLPADPGGR